MASCGSRARRFPRILKPEDRDAGRAKRRISPPPANNPLLHPRPDEDDPAAVRAWAPSAAFRDAVRSVVLATLAQYLGIIETLADEADREDVDNGETMH